MYGTEIHFNHQRINERYRRQAFEFSAWTTSDQEIKVRLNQHASLYFEEAQVCLQRLDSPVSRCCGVDEPPAVLLFPLLGLSLGLSDGERQSFFLAQIPVCRLNHFIRRSSWCWLVAAVVACLCC